MNSINKKEYFTRFPNKYIQGNIQTKFGVGRKFYITYLLIDKYRSYEDYSWITVKEVLEFYGYKNSKNKPKAFNEVLDVLEYMINNRMIKVIQDLNSINYDTGIKIQIIPENFDYPANFAKISSSQLDSIMTDDSSINKESLLMAFLYINSYIGCRQISKNESRPGAFWKSTRSISDELGMSKTTVNECLKHLTSGNDGNLPLLIKKELGYQIVKGQKKALPNIYVLNIDGYEQEIEWAMDKLREIYKNEENLNE